MLSKTFGHYQTPTTAPLEDLEKVILVDFFNRFSKNCSKSFMDKLYHTLIEQSQSNSNKPPIFDIWLHKTEPAIYFSINPAVTKDESKLTPRFLCFAPAESL